MKKIIFGILTIISININSYATTWNEPWQDAIIKKAESFVLCKVIEHDSSKVKAKLIKNIAGQSVSENFEIDNFYFLNLSSISGGHGVEFEFSKNIDTVYFFLVKGENGKYKISTPTSGFSYVFNNKVYATYRHSYHQALVDNDVYEQTTKAIYNSYKGQSYDTTYIRQYIEKSLSIPPGIEETFFIQHVALETIYHLKLSGYEKLILPFIDKIDNFHHQVSGIRALSVTKTKETIEKLITVLEGKQDNFSKVIAIWALDDLNAVEYKKQLKKVSKKKFAKKETGFGGNIMDPRVGTYFPSNLKDSILDLLKKWG